MVQPILWLVLAAIHFLPALAFFRPAGLTMQHRAGLFVAVVAACVFAALVPEGRRLAAIVVGISMVSFLYLYLANGSPPPLRRIAAVDLAGLPVLAGAAFLAYR
jgi:hypothetical protein